MKRSSLFFCFILIASYSFAQKNSWKIVAGNITTPWADSVNPANVLAQYPRPQMQRNDWTNLNGLWQYSILPKSNENIPSKFQGNILVPFAIESSLSGVKKSVGKDSIVWYQRTFEVPLKRKSKKILLHFGAIDWQSIVYINGKKIGMHEGGYDPFTFDITDYLNKDPGQQLSIRVWDPTDDGPQPRGKQVVHPGGIWYTSVTGIWQTVWLEIVPETYIQFTKQTANLDDQTITVSASVNNLQPGDEINISAWKGDEKIAEKNSTDTFETLKINNPQTWSPAHPFLYDLKLTVTRKRKVIDEVKSYFAMRKISIAPDKNGIQKIMLNNTFLFEFGPLDQGWWPDGLYTAPTDDALQFDIATIKNMGCNMIRKHIKVEPARWYYYCDKIGLLVWQDMPSGDLGNGWEPRPGILGNQTDKARTAESEGYYRKEWNAIMDALYNFPCIVVWTPFNEAWGQFKTIDITNKTMQKDTSRLVNSASGGNYYDVGNLLDLHNYPEPAMPKPEFFGTKKAIVLGEFGGLGLPVNGHTWQQKNWGYQSFKNKDSLFMRYSSLITHLEELVRKGLSAAVYTQTTDVEGEVNGFMTYDRKVMKMPLSKLKEVNEKLYTIDSANDEKQ